MLSKILQLYFANYSLSFITVLRAMILKLKINIPEHQRLFLTIDLHTAIIF